MTDEASFIISDLTCFPTTVLQLEALRTVRSQVTISYKSLKQNLVNIEIELSTKKKININLRTCYKRL